ncbi:conserved Plasmodium protein, unknown function [Plasmodium sp. gorilla clade G2]|uniref:conserved Plasmodium protein, unknown function n=1 Tax=Plasmodium sp. gorilla clade G2 TaxID=880535 RepID=UPI000D1FE7D6|nr:conserved Plasmodium protein, unknown function [Plasmodium sp. gorilla clade G2]SOV16513.1 conserved Plasmodium protein, unknown function [Plasmodium sp. gorilla clade G2]
MNIINYLYQKSKNIYNRNINLYNYNNIENENLISNFVDVTNNSNLCYSKESSSHSSIFMNKNDHIYRNKKNKKKNKIKNNKDKSIIDNDSMSNNSSSNNYCGDFYNNNIMNNYNDVIVKKKYYKGDETHVSYNINKKKEKNKMKGKYYNDNISVNVNININNYDIKLKYDDKNKYKNNNIKNNLNSTKCSSNNNNTYDNQGEKNNVYEFNIDNIGFDSKVYKNRCDGVCVLNDNIYIFDKIKKCIYLYTPYNNVWYIFLNIYEEMSLRKNTLLSISNCDIKNDLNENINKSYYKYHNNISFINYTDMVYLNNSLFIISSNAHFMNICKINVYNMNTLFSTIVVDTFNDEMNNFQTFFNLIKRNSDVNSDKTTMNKKKDTKKEKKELDIFDDKKIYKCDNNDTDNYNDNNNDNNCNVHNNNKRNDFKNKHKNIDNYTNNCFTCDDHKNISNDISCDDYKNIQNDLCFDKNGGSNNFYDQIGYNNNNISKNESRDLHEDIKKMNQDKCTESSQFYFNSKSEYNNNYEEYVNGMSEIYEFLQNEKNNFFKKKKRIIKARDYFSICSVNEDCYSLIYLFGGKGNTIKNKDEYIDVIYNDLYLYDFYNNKWVELYPFKQNEKNKKNINFELINDNSLIDDIHIKKRNDNLLLDIDKNLNTCNEKKSYSDDICDDIFDEQKNYDDFSLFSCNNILPNNCEENNDSPNVPNKGLGKNTYDQITTTVGTIGTISSTNFGNDIVESVGEVTDVRGSFDNVICSSSTTNIKNNEQNKDNNYEMDHHMDSLLNNSINNNNNNINNYPTEDVYNLICDSSDNLDFKHINNNKCEKSDINMYPNDTYNKNHNKCNILTNEKTNIYHERNDFLCFNCLNNKKCTYICDIIKNDIKIKSIEWLSKRAGHSCVYYKSNLYIFGGIDFYSFNSNKINLNFCNNLFIYNIETNKCFEIIGKGEIPEKRYRHSCVLINDYMFIIGGECKNSSLPKYDIYFYDFSNSVWTEILINSKIGSNSLYKTVWLENFGSIYLFGSSIIRLTKKDFQYLPYNKKKKKQQGIHTNKKDYSAKNYFLSKSTFVKKTDIL